MDNVIGVSWPRSGHHLLVRLLQFYFGDSLRYCDFYGGVADCCKTMPCTRTNDIDFTKSHDFDLTLPQIEGRKYLVQYREYLPSTVSNYELFLLGKPRELDTKAFFTTFASQQFTSYRQFMERWVTSDFAKSQLQLSYEQLIVHPRECLRLAVWWFMPNAEIDEDRINQAVSEVAGEKVEAWSIKPIEKAGVHSNRDLTSFRHYDPALFKRLSKLRLTRVEVDNAFQMVLGRKPAEASYLTFQALGSVADMEAALRESEEYRLLQAKRADLPPT